VTLFAAEDAQAAGAPAEDDCFTVNLAVLQPGTMAPVDLYIKAGHSDRLVLYKSAGAAMNEQVRRRLLDNQVSTLYISKRQKKSYYDYIEQNISTIIQDEGMALEEACTLVYENSRRIMQDVFHGPRSGRNLKRVQTMVEPMVMSIMRNPNTLWHMTALASHDYQVYSHSICVALLLVAASRHVLGVRGEQTLKRIAYGGALHDIGLCELPKELLSKRGNFTDDEFERYKEHPLIGVDIISRFNTPSPTSMAIVRSHHENVGGHGYPDGLVGEAIPPVARLARIVDAYDISTTSRPTVRACTPYDSLRTMLKMDRQFDIPLLRCFVSFLGPKHPRTPPA